MSAHHHPTLRTLKTAADLTKLAVSSRACGRHLVPAAHEWRLEVSVIIGDARLRGRYTESVEGGDAMSRDRADVAEHGSGEAVEPPQVP